MMARVGKLGTPVLLGRGIFLQGRGNHMEVIYELINEIDQRKLDGSKGVVAPTAIRTNKTSVKKDYYNMNLSNERMFCVGQTVVTPYGFGEIVKFVNDKYVVLIDDDNNYRVQVSEADIASIEDYVAEGIAELRQMAIDDGDETERFVDDELYDYIVE